MRCSRLRVLAGVCLVVCLNNAGLGQVLPQERDTTWRKQPDGSLKLGAYPVWIERNKGPGAEYVVLCPVDIEARRFMSLDVATDYGLGCATMLPNHGFDLNADIQKPIFRSKDWVAQVDGALALSDYHIRIELRRGGSALNAPYILISEFHGKTYPHWYLYQAKEEGLRLAKEIDELVPANQPPKPRSKPTAQQRGF